MPHPFASIGVAVLLGGPHCLDRVADTGPPPTLRWIEKSAVIGGRNALRLDAAPGKTLRAVVWEVEGAILSQVIDERGFHNTPLPCPLVVQPGAGATDSVVRFFWDPRPGNHTIQVRAVYSDGTVGTPEGAEDDR